MDAVIHQIVFYSGFCTPNFENPCKGQLRRSMKWKPVMIQKRPWNLVYCAVLVQYSCSAPAPSSLVTQNGIASSSGLGRRIRRFSILGKDAITLTLNLCVDVTLHLQPQMRTSAPKASRFCVLLCITVHVLKYLGQVSWQLQSQDVPALLARSSIFIVTENSDTCYRLRMIDLWQVIILSTCSDSQLDVQSLKDGKVCEAVKLLHECPIAIY